MIPTNAKVAVVTQTTGPRTTQMPITQDHGVVSVFAFARSTFCAADRKVNGQYALRVNMAVNAAKPIAKIRDHNAVDAAKNPANITQVTVQMPAPHSSKRFWIWLSLFLDILDDSPLTRFNL